MTVRRAVPPAAEAEVKALLDATGDDQCGASTPIPGLPGSIEGCCLRQPHGKGRHLFAAYQDDQMFAVDWAG